MPIDPSIILGIKPVQPPDELGGFQKSLTLQGLMGQQKLQALQYDQAKQAADDENAVKQAYAESGGDSATLRALLQKRGAYKQLQALDKFDLEKREKESLIGKNTATANKSTYDITIDKLQRGASILSTAKDQASYDTARRQLALTLGPDVVGSMPGQFDPTYVQSKIAEGQTIAQRLTDQRAREAHAQTAANAPFIPGPSGPAAQPAVQEYEMNKRRAGAPNVNVRTEVKTGESLAAQVGPMMKDSTTTAEGAVKQVQAAQQIVQAVDSGKIIAGPGANARLTGAQVADLIGAGGADNAEKIANTRQALRGLAQLTLQGRQQMRGQGAITERENELAQRAESGDITFTAAELKQLAQASERAARFNYAEHQRKMKIMESNPALSGIAPFYQGPAMPDTPTPAAPAAPQLGERKSWQGQNFIYKGGDPAQPSSWERAR